MPPPTNPYRHLAAQAWIVVVACALAAIILGVLVNGNGELPWLSEGASLLLILAVAVIGIVADALAIYLDRRHGWFGALLAMFYLVFFLPAVMEFPGLVEYLLREWGLRG